MCDVDLRGLCDKYERILALRLAHDLARDSRDAFAESPSPQDAMRELARRFPGALRELDRLPVEVIRTRIDELRSAQENPMKRQAWMSAQARFHALARGALAAKQWLRGRPLSVDLKCAFLCALDEMPSGNDARIWAFELESLASPPRGRLMDVVYAKLASELGTNADPTVNLALARDLVFARSSTWT